MNIYTIRLSKKLMFTAGSILIALILALVLLLSGGDAAPTASMGTLKNKGDQVEYLESLGYTVDQGSMVSKKVTIPKTFDDVYLTYNKMQQDCGFDLVDYAGKTVRLVTYSITNYPTGEEVLADLLLAGDKLIGGAVYTTAIDGFMHGLRPADK